MGDMNLKHAELGEGESGTGRRGVCAMVIRGKDTDQGGKRAHAKRRSDCRVGEPRICPPGVSPHRQPAFCLHGRHDNAGRSDNGKGSTLSAKHSGRTGMPTSAVEARHTSHSAARHRPKGVVLPVLPLFSFCGYLPTAAGKVAAERRGGARSPVREGSMARRTQARERPDPSASAPPAPPSAASRRPGARRRNIQFVPSAPLRPAVPPQGTSHRTERARARARCPSFLPGRVTVQHTAEGPQVARRAVPPVPALRPKRRRTLRIQHPIPLAPSTTTATITTTVCASAPPAPKAKKHSNHPDPRGPIQFLQFAANLLQFYCHVIAMSLLTGGCWKDQFAVGTVNGTAGPYKNHQLTLGHAPGATYGSVPPCVLRHSKGAWRSNRGRLQDLHERTLRFECSPLPLAATPAVGRVQMKRLPLARRATPHPGSPGCTLMPSGRRRLAEVTKGPADTLAPESRGSVPYAARSQSRRRRHAAPRPPAEKTGIRAHYVHHRLAVGKWDVSRAATQRPATKTALHCLKRHACPVVGVRRDLRASLPNWDRASLGGDQPRAPRRGTRGGPFRPRTHHGEDAPLRMFSGLGPGTCDGGGSTSCCRHSAGAPLPRLGEVGPHSAGTPRRRCALEVPVHDGGLLPVEQGEDGEELAGPVAHPRRRHVLRLPRPPRQLAGQVPLRGAGGIPGPDPNRRRVSGSPAVFSFRLVATLQRHSTVLHHDRHVAERLGAGDAGAGEEGRRRLVAEDLDRAAERVLELDEVGVRREGADDRDLAQRVRHLLRHRAHEAANGP
eukprot:gene42-biopygen11138